MDSKGYQRSFSNIENLGVSLSKELISQYEESMESLMENYIKARAVEKQASEALNFISAYLTAINAERGFYDSITLTKELPSVIRLSLIKIADFLRDRDTITGYDLACITSGLGVLYTFTGIITTDLELISEIAIIEEKLTPFTKAKVDTWYGNILEIWGHTMLGFPEIARKKLKNLKKRKKPLLGVDIQNLSADKNKFKNNDWVGLIEAMKERNLAI